MKTSSDRPLATCRPVVKTALVVLSLVAMMVFTTQADAQSAADTSVVTITNTVVGDVFFPTTFTISPDVDGCTAEQKVTIGASGGQVSVPVAAAVAGTISFDSNDFVITPVFSDVKDFDFAIDLQGIASGSNFVNSPFAMIDYTVFGSLDDTPSGFPAFNLVRPITFADFVTQGSSLAFVTKDDADMADGLQVADLVGTNDVFILDAREVDTGRYHPPVLVLRADGTGRIENSNNQGGINPSSLEEVDVAVGEEYISDLVFDPDTLTLAPGLTCTYTVTQSTDSLYESDPGSVAGVQAGSQADFVTTAASLTCNSLFVTINMNTNGGNGIGTPGNDVIIGTAGADLIDGGDGDDTICAAGGDDVVIGGSGDDVLFGGDGADVMRGNSGKDYLLGEDGRDRLLGGIDDDTIDGGPGDDYLGGFGGADTIDGALGDDVIFGGFGADIIDGGLGDDEVHGLVGDDLIFGGPGNDILDGDRGNDTIGGWLGDDVIRGGNADDRLFGDEGDDSVGGGKGDDDLVGGDGLGDLCAGNEHHAGDTADASCEFIFSVP